MAGIKPGISGPLGRCRLRQISWAIRFYFKGGSLEHFSCNIYLGKSLSLYKLKWLCSCLEGKQVEYFASIHFFN